jgi:hypothetical protein
MKQLVFFTIMLAAGMDAYSQNGNSRRKIILKETPKTLSIENQKYVPPPLGLQLPDLTIVSFDARFLGTQLIDGVTKNQIEVTYKIKNEGTASIAANKIGWQGWVSYVSSNPKMIPGGGAAITATAATDVIEAGATRQGSFRVSVAFDKNNHPLYTMYLDDLNMVNESNEQNNIAQMAITF